MSLSTPSSSSVLLAAVLFLTSGCATAPRPAAPLADSAAQEELEDAAQSATLLFQTLAAEVAAQRGEAGTAFATLLNAARESGDARLARRATELALANRALPQALEAARLWHQQAPSSDEAAHAFAALLVAHQEFDAAAAVYAPWVAQNPVKHLIPLQYVIPNAPDPKRAFELLDQLTQPALKKSPQQAADLHLILAAGAAAAGLQPRVTEEILAAQALRPDDEKIALDAALYLAGANPESSAAAPRRAQALALLQKFLQQHPEAQEARLRYARLLAADHQREAAIKELQQLLTQNADHLDVLYTLSALTATTPPHTQARAYTQRYLDALTRQSLPAGQMRDPALAYLHLSRLAADEHHFEEALEWARKVGPGAFFFSARLQEALLLGRLKRVEQGRKMLAALRPVNEEQRVQVVLTDAALLRDAHRPREAYERLTQALRNNADEPNLLYDAAMVAERLNKLDAMEAHLRRLIELQPDHAHAHNALGYTWVERNIRLDEAQKLLERAHELAPDDAAITDSVGWLYFRRGQLPEARKLLEEAFKLRPEADVGAHLGEVLWVMGERDAARVIWRQARAFDPNAELLRQTLQRLKVKL